MSDDEGRELMIRALKIIKDECEESYMCWVQAFRQTL